MKDSTPSSKAQSSNPLPQHVAVIMDGNGRWAKSRGLPRAHGHRAGAESLRAVAERCVQLHIPYLTVYAFSSENWIRPQEEIDTLMKLLERFLREKTPELIQQGIRLHTIGNTSQLPQAVQTQLQHSLQATAEGSKLTLTLALSYGARADLTEAARKLAQQVKAGQLQPEDISEEYLAAALSTAQLPEPDLLIRTSGELRLSNFLLWEISYAEIIVTQANWPAFRAQEFEKALEEYQNRKRRFGGV